MKPLAVYSPWDLQSSEPPDMSSQAYRFLAEGDSWFTIGSLNPAKTDLLRDGLRPVRLRVELSSPGDTLQHHIEDEHDRNFVNCCGPHRQSLDAVLLSCGGNDLIDAMQVGPRVRRRRDAAEAANGRSVIGRHVTWRSGWQTSPLHEANLKNLVQRAKRPSRLRRLMPVRDADTAQRPVPGWASDPAGHRC